MHKRYRRQNIQRILFRYGPMDLGRMSRCISEGAEQAFYQVHQTSVLASLALCRKAVERQPRMPTLSQSEGFIHERGAIASKAGALPDFLRNAFCRLEYRVKIIINHQLRAAE